MVGDCRNGTGKKGGAAKRMSKKGSRREKHFTTWEHPQKLPVPRHRESPQRPFGPLRAFAKRLCSFSASIEGGCRGHAPFRHRMAGESPLCLERAAAHYSLLSEFLQTLPQKMEGSEKPGAEAPELPIICYCARYRKVTICPRVQGASGLKLLPPVPEVTPSFTAQATASA